MGIKDSHSSTSQSSSDVVASGTHYEVLGIDETASLVDIRGAYRRLALRHHPDRAGPQGKAAFVRISAAYRVLSNSIERATYDSELRQLAMRLRRSSGRPDMVPGAATEIGIGPDGRPVVKKRNPIDVLPRLSGTRDELIRAGVLTVEGDGTMVLHLNAHEARTGGTAVIELTLSIRCPTCGGVSRPNGVWCRTCEFTAVVVQPVSVLVAVPAEVLSGTLEVISTRQLPETRAPLRFRFDCPSK